MQHDECQVIGDEIWYGGYLVGRVTIESPASVREEFLRALDRSNPKGLLWRQERGMRR